MQNRTVINQVSPEIQAGRFPIKRVVGERVDVQAVIFGDGHDALRAEVRYRLEGTRKWDTVSMDEHPNDRWTSSFTVTERGFYEYELVAWVDHLLTWYRGFKKKQNDGQDMKIELEIGCNLMEEAAKGHGKGKAVNVLSMCDRLREDYDQAVGLVMSEEFARFIDEHEFKQFPTTYEKNLRVRVGRTKELYSTWYELFPRSTSPDIDRAGTFKDVENLLPRIEELGFDVLYMPPIHPVGRRNRKGRNNATDAQEGEPGSPWAIGSSEGGHKAILPELGNIDDYKELIVKAEERGIEVALDLAFQCAPDHPYIKQHPDWFIWRPDGSIMYAENPPKKYQDIVPINFESKDWENLWEELKSVVIYWCEAGVKIFRVDNPHTKPYRFWEWLIREVQEVYPDTIFLAEAFTRPAIMAELAKRGFTQSYSYFTWRPSASEMRQYVEELTQTELKEYMRANFWPNTPDILAYEMMDAVPAQFLKRLILAGTLSSNYGLYGPSYEVTENRGNTNGKEEYYDSEKYMVRHYDWSYRNKITEAYQKLNRARRENPALQQMNNIIFTGSNNGSFLSYVKWNDDRTNFIWTIVNFDPHNTQATWVNVPREQLGITGRVNLGLTDIFTGQTFYWKEEANFVQLDPGYWPAHVLKVTVYND